MVAPPVGETHQRQEEYLIRTEGTKPRKEFRKNPWKRKMKENPLVPIGLAFTVGCLLGGVRAIITGNDKLLTHTMFGRVFFQGGTAALIWYGFAERKSPIPLDAVRRAGTLEELEKENEE